MRRVIPHGSDVERLVDELIDRRTAPGRPPRRRSPLRSWYRRASSTDSWFLLAHVARASIETAPGASVLDAGAGEQQYRWLFDHARYVACDFGKGDDAWNYSGIDTLCDLEAVPLRSGSFDVCLLTEVLEHVARPELVMAELARILRPGGRIYVTVPFAFPEHQAPHDFHRYTSFALRRLAEVSGLAPTEVTMRTGFAGFVAFYLGVAFDSYVAERSARLRPAARRAMAPLLSLGRGALVAARIGLYLADTDSGICVGYNCVLTKPLPAEAAPPG